MAEWKEEEHPRADDGKFTDGKGFYRQNTPHEVLAKEKPQEGSLKQKREPKFISARPKEMKNALSQAKATHLPEDQWRVDDTYTAEDYSHAICWVSEGGSTVAVKDGDIISVCKYVGDNVRGRDLLRHAIENGGNRLDAFGEDLYDFYTQNGFSPVSWTPFDREYAPYDWKPEYGEEPVIFYMYTGKEKTEPYEEFLKRVQSSADYDEAKSIRDGELKT